MLYEPSRLTRPRVTEPGDVPACCSLGQEGTGHGGASPAGHLGSEASFFPTPQAEPPPSLLVINRLCCGSWQRRDPSFVAAPAHRRLLLLWEKGRPGAQV